MKRAREPRFSPVCPTTSRSTSRPARRPSAARPPSASGARDAGREHVRRPRRPRGHERVAQRAAAAGGGLRRQPPPARRARRRQRAARYRRGARTSTPASACTASSTPSTAASTSSPTSSRSTPTASIRASTSPTSRRSSSWPCTRPAGWQVVANTPAVKQPADGEAGEWAFAPTPLLPTYITAVVAGPYHVERSLAPRRRPRRLLPAVARRAPRRGRDRRDHRPGPRLLRAACSTASTRSRSTTRCSCPSSTRARWRTRRASPSSRPTCSAPRSPTRNASGGPRRSCTSWRTCGSATS